MTGHPVEHFLVAIDGTAESIKSIRYLVRVLRGATHIRFTLFHVLPATSPNLLKKDELKRIEQIHERHAHLSGYFWSKADEDQMQRIFESARELLIAERFAQSQIFTRFCVQYADVAQHILAEAKHLNCSTVVVGRRGLSRVQELLQGSVSTSVTRQARDLTVWVVDN